MMALADGGMTGTAADAVDEPFHNLLTQGMVLKDGSKMSKSKGNIVDPDDIFKAYGADTARFFILSDSPPQIDFDWKDSAVEGCYKFLQRVWRVITENSHVLDLSQVEKALTPATAEQKALYQQTHKAIAGITQDITEAFQFNTVMSKLRELVNAMSKYSVAEESKDPVFSHAVYHLLLLMAPITPHLTEALWQRFNPGVSIHVQPWPVHDPAALIADEVEVVVQVNGKVRDRLQVPHNTPKEQLEAMALASDRVRTFIDGQSVVKIIVVPNKLVSLVVKPA